ncbi:glycosyltransferase 1 domain-containing protein 1-like isoform X2 [Mercenaria mercenaria]|uniref:glycosyltransferase 1 domain-containing protein 1-like isoform X2 n=1 Tax=Mercenaria mercenaria TaxID=6596 RepID=UPI00234EE5C5|nr:glycosyltransferase 1 domain-containing protein 1-like isoform X2 [Mercenaria mercenaria]
MKALLLSPLMQLSGNLATISRIKKGLEKSGLQCYLKCPLELSDSKALERVLDELDIDVVIAVHVYKSGKLLVDSTKPYLLILGGTDVNELTGDKEKMDIMTKAVNNSRHIVAFSESLVKKFKSCWPDYNGSDISIIPQGVEVCPSSFSIQSYIQSHVSVSREVTTDQVGEQNGLYGFETDTLLRQLTESESRIFTVVGGIRPVKNPLYLIKKFSEWRHTKDRGDCWLLFVGAHQNDSFFKSFEEEVLRCPGVVYIPGLSTEDTHAVIRDSFALVNCSDSEGMALAILEAMALRTPVIVRNIPGNTAIVNDGKTGFIYDTPQAFIEKVESLLENPDLVGTVVHGAFSYTSEEHSVENEEKSYFTLLKKYC